jgi:hypothetical protein
MRLQQSRSTAVIAATGITHAIIGVARRTSDTTETPILPNGFMTLKKVYVPPALDAIRAGAL